MNDPSIDASWDAMNALDDDGAVGLEHDATMADSGREAVSTCSSEVCSNSIDDDCDGHTDEAAGEESDGSCDGTDNDCDGRIDEHLISQLSPITWTDAPTEAQSGTAFTLKRAEGGAWVVFRAWKGSSSAPASGPITLRLLDEQGLPVADQPFAVLPETDDTMHFTAASDGSFVAVARTTATNPKLALSLYRASDLHLLATKPGAGTANETDTPIRLSMMKDAQDIVRVLTAFSVTTTSGGRTTQVAAYRYDDVQGTLADAGKGVSVPYRLSPSNLAIERIPCRDEWLLVYALNPITSASIRDVRRVGPDGDFVSATAEDELGSALIIDGLGATSANCDAEDPEMLVVFRRGTSDETRLVRWSIDRTSGALSRLGAEVQIEGFLQSVSLSHWRGRWFVAANYGTSTELGQDARVPALAEAEFTDEGAEIRWLPSTDERPGNQTRLVRHGLVNTGDVLVTTAPNSFEETSNLSANDAAITYRVGCN